MTAADLPPRGGIVCKANFKDYFGPFAARAFCEAKININKATRSQLQAAWDIGPEKANDILNERKNKGDFKDREDFKKRLKMDRTLSEAFKYN